ncbi:MAG TPA: hypothetical protein VNZ05_04275 [Solirubrobacteraceae bacterium]|jgi:hypothetical protein|nr:hypothetical protein [Solirubrobacteraceae bacterium]
MRWTKQLGTALIAVFAYGASSAGGAAASPLLLKVEGEVESQGTPTYGFVSLATHGLTCEQVVAGTLLINAKPKDRAAFNSVAKDSCGIGASLSGMIDVVELTSTGRFILKASPSLAMAVPGPCVYEGSKLRGTFAIPGSSISYNLSGTFKLNSKLSAGSCAKTAKIEGSTGSIYEIETFEYFVTER